MLPWKQHLTITCIGRTGVWTDTVVVAREAWLCSQVLLLELIMIYFNLRPEWINWHGLANWDSWTTSIPPSHRTPSSDIYLGEDTSGMHVWFTSQTPHSTARRSHQRVIAAPVPTCLVAGCKPNAHIGNSQQRGDKSPGLVTSKLKLFTSGGGKQAAALAIPRLGNRVGGLQPNGAALWKGAAVQCVLCCSSPCPAFLLSLQ